MAEYVPGDNLTSHPHLDVLSARSPDALKALLDQIRLPYKVISVYGLGGRHFAWVSLTAPIKKKKKKTVTKKKGIRNG